MCGMLRALVMSQNLLQQLPGSFGDLKSLEHLGRHFRATLSPDICLPFNSF